MATTINTDWSALSDSQRKYQINLVLVGYKNVGCWFILSELQTDLMSKGFKVSLDECIKIINELEINGKIVKQADLYRAV